MKKGLLILLIALLAVSAFAADISAGVKFTISAGDDGFFFSGNEIWHAPLTLSVSSDNAGATYKFDLIQPGFTNGAYDSQIWFKPIPELKITIGSTGSSWIDNGLIGSDSLYYAKTELLVVEPDPKSQPKIKTSYTDFFVELGVAYKPSEGLVYLADNFNIGIRKGNSFFHTDTLAKFDVDGKDVSLISVLSEFTGVYEPEIYVASYKKIWDNAFNIGNGDLFGSEENWKLIDLGGSYLNNQFVIAGFRYKYYTEESQLNKNGLYAYGKFAGKASTTATDLGFVVDAEVGKNGADIYTRDTVNYKYEYSTTTKAGSPETHSLPFTMENYAAFNFDWSGDKLQARLSETNNKVSCTLDAGTPYTEFKYLNKPENSAKDNGWYLKPGFTGDVGIYNYDASFRFGFDGDKNYHWNVKTLNSVNF